MRRLLTEAAQGCPDVLASPPPQVLLTALGGDKMSFELTVWHDARGPLRSQLSSDLAFLIDQRLRANGLRGS